MEVAGAAQPLQIPHQGQGAVRMTLPAETLIRRQLHTQGDGDRLACEADEFTAQNRNMAKIPERGGALVEIAQDRGQDGEMGHGADARFARP